MPSLSTDQMAELEMLRRDAGGNLLPADIVDFARSANTALHSAFTWDDTEAARRHRLAEAKSVIRVAITYLPSPTGTQVPVRMYAFDPSRNSYTTTAKVLEREDATEALLRQMLADVHRCVARYRRHAELAPKIAAMLEALATPAEGGADG